MQSFNYLYIGVINNVKLHCTGLTTEGMGDCHGKNYNIYKGVQISNQTTFFGLK